MTTNALCTQWLELPEEKITVNKVREVLGAVPSDDWVVAAAADKIVDNVDVQRTILTVGLERTKPAVDRSHKAMLSMDGPVDVEEREDDSMVSEDQLRHASLAAHFTKHTTDELLCQLRAVLLERLDRLETYIEMSKELVNGKERLLYEPEDGWDELDPWDPSPDEVITEEEDVRQDHRPHVSLSAFLRNSFLHTALLFALNLHFGALGVLFRRHADSLNAHRLYILQSIPEYAHPSEYHTLLPAVDPSTEFEIIPPKQPWRDQLDWTETKECISAFGQGDATKMSSTSPKTSPHSASDISHWYQDRISQADNAGLVDVALALVQHGASQGVPGLDNLGEELGLLTRLVYDAPRPAGDGPRDDGWTLSRWRSLDPPAVVRAYLAHATPETIVDNIRRLVMPYLFVLESREERAGKPDPDLANRLFYEYVLQASLELVVIVFEASKPTLLPSERLIKNDEDMARLALACLYGSVDVSDWGLKSQIFECLPEWSGATKDVDDEADTTLLSLGDFVTPSVAKPRCTPQELFLFFSPLPAFALSRILDVLDVHLESGEILAHWNVAAPLRWFLLSADDVGQQRAWATRMSRRAGGGGDEPETEEEWLELLEDMLKLVGGGEGALRGAFGLLSKEEVTRFFFSGLLSSGRFRVAKSILRKSRMPYLSDPQIVEDQILASSREFYDNATSGNINQGDMKLAYECLTVAPSSPAIQREREFIEATSRICSFNVVSRQGIPISPIEIRLVKDRLSLVARVLSSTADAYKHAEVILDLVHKLGYRGDVTAEVKAFAMLADAALQAEDFVRAAETAERMVDIVRKFDAGEPKQVEAEAKEVCWRSCFQLGRQTEFRDVDKKLSLLGHALELCPPEHMLDVLGVWRKIEGENIRIRRESLVAHKENASSRRRQAPASATASFRIRPQELQFGSSTSITPDATAAAALASRTLRSVAASFPFSVRGKEPEDGRKSWDAGAGGDHPDVSTHAKQALARGIGWLIGADEEQ